MNKRNVYLLLLVLYTTFYSLDAQAQTCLAIDSVVITNGTDLSTSVGKIRFAYTGIDINGDYISAVANYAELFSAIINVCGTIDTVFSFCAEFPVYTESGTFNAAAGTCCFLEDGTSQYYSTSYNNNSGELPNFDTTTAPDPAGYGIITDDEFALITTIWQNVGVSLNMSNNDATALQVLIWELQEDQTLDLTTGNFFLRTPDNLPGNNSAMLIDIINGWVTNVQNGTWVAQSDLALITHPTNQDLLIEIDPCVNCSIPTEPDLALFKSVNQNIAQIGDVVTYTIKVTNEGATLVTGVQVTDALPIGLIFNGIYTASQGTFDGTIWNIGDISASTDTVYINFEVLVNNDGVFTNTAEISLMDGTDIDSTPNNALANEDDIANACFSVPIEICNDGSQSIELMAPDGHISYQWYIDLGNGLGYQAIASIAGGDQQTYTTTMAGSYLFTLDGTPLGNCGTQLCCPIILQAIPLPICTTIIVTKL